MLQTGKEKNPVCRELRFQYKKKKKKKEKVGN